MRPSFKDGFRCETQIIATVLSVDNENEYDILALNAASLGLQLAGVPLESAVGAVRMSLINDNWVVQATNSELEDSVFNMVVAGSLNNSGDDASGEDTVCDVVICGENEYVLNHVCTSLSLIHI